MGAGRAGNFGKTEGGILDRYASLSMRAEDIINAAELGKGNVLLEKVTNPKLRNTIKEIYRPGAKIGDGGLADAIRHEIKTGELVGGKSHIQKGKERLRNLEKILSKETLNRNEKSIIKDLIKDLRKALGGK